MFSTFLKKSFLSFFLVSLQGLLNAQTPFNCTYLSSVESAPYNSIGIFGNGSFSTNLWDNASFINTIFITGGFNFNGNIYNSCNVHSDGYIWFGTGGAPASGASTNNILALPSLGLGNGGVIAAFARDLNQHPSLAAIPVPPPSGPFSSRPLVQWRSFGFSPNRYTVIEYIGFFPKVTGCGGAPDHHRVDFQIRLYENNPAGLHPNRIEIYHRDQSPFCNDQPYSFQVGIRGINPQDYSCWTQPSGDLTPTSSVPGISPSDKINFLADDNVGPGVKFIFDYKPSPVIAPGPTSNTCPSTSVNLSTTFNGNLRWYKDNNPVSGPEGAGKTFTATSSGSYKVVHTAGNCTYESSPVNVTITSCGVQPPVINTEPQSLLVCRGKPAVFTVSASGNPVLSYAWRKNTIPVSGADQPSYTIAAAELQDTGNYDVVVSNSDGSVTSTTVTLTVLEVTTPLIEHR